MQIAKSKSYHRNLSLLLPILIYLGGTNLYEAISSGPEWLKLNIWLILTIGIIVIWVRAIRRWIDQQPAFVLDKNGLVDNISMVQPGNIPWQRVTGAEVKKYAGALQLLIYVEEAERYITGLSYIQGKMAEQMLADEGTPFVINTKFINYDANKLAKEISKRARGKK